MAFILLDVPFVSQNDIGGQTGHAHHSEQNGCWYASTCMVSYFWEAGPRLGVPKQYKRNPGDPEPMGKRYKELKKNENFEGVPLPARHSWTTVKLFNLLENYGPCYVRRGYRDATTGKLTGGHAVVLSGADIALDRVMVLDPWETKNEAGKGRQTYGIAEFNDFFKWQEDWARGISLMYKKQRNVVDAAAYIKTHRLDAWG